MSKKIYLNNSREKIIEGVNLYADAVKSTLGPSGKCVIINDGFESIITKDGVTVGNSIDHPDPVINTGIQLVKKVASKTDLDNGDGTTTASVFCRELIIEGMKQKEFEHFNFHDFKQTIELELEIIVKKLEENGLKLTLNDVHKVALTASNNDIEIASLLQVAFNNAQEDGNINLVESVTGKSYVDILKGFVVDLGFMDRRFGNNPVTGFFEAAKCRVLIYDNEFTDRQQMIKLVQKLKEPIPTLIFAKDFSKDVLAIVDHNNSMNVNFSGPICLIKNQLRNEEYSNLITDISVYVGVEPITYFDEFDFEFGEANDVVVKEGVTIFGSIDGTQKDIVDLHLKELSEAAKQQKSNFIKESILKRIDRINNGVTTYYVGGNSDIEIKEKMHRVVDAYKACKLALKGKVIMGGGQALVLLSKDYNECDSYQDCFTKMVRKPFYEILENSYHDNANAIRERLSFEKGYNVKTRKFENLYDSGIVDPVDGIVNGLRNAVSIALTILSTECLIVEIPNT